MLTYRDQLLRLIAHFLGRAWFFAGLLIVGPALAEQLSWNLSIETNGAPKHLGEQVNIYATLTNVSHTPIRLAPLPDLDCPILVFDADDVEVPLTERAKPPSSDPRDPGFQPVTLGRLGPFLGGGDAYKLIFDLRSYVRIEHAGAYSAQLRIRDSGGGPKRCISSNVIHFTILS